MKFKTFGATYTRKFNLGNYESVEIGASVYADVDMDDEVDKTLNYMLSVCKKSVADNVPPSYKKMKSNVSIKFSEPATENLEKYDYDIEYDNYGKINNDE